MWTSVRALGNQLCLRGKLLWGKSCPPGFAIPLVSSLHTLELPALHQSHPTKPRDGYVPCPANPTYVTPNCPWAQVFWAANCFPTTHSAGRRGQWAGATGSPAKPFGPLQVSTQTGRFPFPDHRQEGKWHWFFPGRDIIGWRKAVSEQFSWIWPEF